MFIFTILVFRYSWSCFFTTMRVFVSSRSRFDLYFSWFFMRFFPIKIRFFFGIQLPPTTCPSLLPSARPRFSLKRCDSFFWFFFLPVFRYQCDSPRHPFVLALLASMKCSCVARYHAVFLRGSYRSARYG